MIYAVAFVVFACLACEAWRIFWTVEPETSRPHLKIKQHVRVVAVLDLED